MTHFFSRWIALATLLAYLAPGATAFAASPPHASAIVHHGQNYVDIYSTTFANLDGDNHYIHVQLTPHNRYVFKYCKDGVSVAEAKEGRTPATRNCPVTIGKKEGYTRGELMAELKLMKTRGDSDFWWGVAGDVGAGVVVFIALSAIEYFTAGAAAPAAAPEQVVSGATVATGVTRLLSRTFLRTVGINASKIVVSTFLGVFVSNQAKARAERKFSDAAFSTPYEQDHLAKEIRTSVLERKGGGTPHGDVLISDEMQSFESDLSQVLGKIQ